VYPDLNGRVVVITGGSTGIGLGAALDFAKQGSKVVIAARNASDLEKAQATIQKETKGASVTVVVADVAKKESLDQLFAAVKKEHGRIDVLFANAGVAVFAPIEAVTPSFFDSQFDINIRGAFFTLQAALPLLSKGSSVVFNTSVVSHKGIQGRTQIPRANRSGRIGAQRHSGKRRCTRSSGHTDLWKDGHARIRSQTNGRRVCCSGAARSFWTAARNCCRSYFSRIGRVVVHPRY
jgi:NAD(P)-dependent dehydrogenase (short-subunit alcohol dehydrogenase family)